MQSLEELGKETGFLGKILALEPEIHAETWFPGMLFSRWARQVVRSVKPLKTDTNSHEAGLYPERPQQQLVAS